MARSIGKELNSFRKGDLDFEELQFDYPDYFDLKVEYTDELQVEEVDCIQDVVFDLSNEAKKEPISLKKIQNTLVDTFKENGIKISGFNKLKNK